MDHPFPRGTRVRVSGEDFSYEGRVIEPIWKLDSHLLRYAIQDDNNRLFFQNPKQVTFLATAAEHDRFTPQVRAANRNY